MEKIKNHYKVDKALRFELKPSRELSFKSGDTKRLIAQFQKIQESFLDIFVYNYQQEEKKYISLEFKKERKVKYTWLRSYLKNEFYENTANKEIKDYELFGLEYVSDEFLRWINEWKELIEGLEEFVNTNEEEQERKSEIAFVVRKFLKRKNFSFIQSFVHSVVDLQNTKATEDDEKIQEFRKLLSEAYTNLKSCEKQYLPAQSGGVVWYKASLNYYTLNKTPKEYEKLKKEKEEVLERKIIDCKKKNGRAEFWFDRKFNFGENPLYWTLDEAYFRMKAWKAEQKSKFNEVIGNFISDYLKKEFNEKRINKTELKIAREILKKFPLFTPKEDKFFISFLEKTKEIKIKSKEKNDILQRNGNIKAKDFEKSITQKIQSVGVTLKEEDIKKILTEDEYCFKKNTEKIDSLKKERGYFFNSPVPTKKLQTQNYEDFCNLYKKIAMKRGEIIADIKSIENEEVQSQLLTHWIVIIEEDEKRKILFIPREREIIENGEKKLTSDNHKNAHDFIKENFDKNNQIGDITLYHFKSLTLRALEKLCFKKIQNTFFPEIKREIESKFIPKYKEEWLNEENECKLVKFYKKVLQTNYVKKYLDLVDFGGLENLLKNEEHDNLESFGLALEKVCYVKVPLKISEEQKNKFIADFGVQEFEITTRSIAGHKRENAHTKIWKNFWSAENEKSNYVTRLNPEMSVFYRDALDTREWNKNRYSKPRFTLATTISLNATSKKSHLAFKTIQDIKDYITEFNEKFNKNFDGEWVYGIDRGLKELATLNVVKFSDEKNEFGVSKPKEFAQIPVYKLRNENAVLRDEQGNVIKNTKGGERKIIDNISEILEEEVEPDSRYFDKDVVSSIDLTQAKLIKGHIIINGDQKTYLKLKELSAKRRIFELFSKGEIDKDSEFSFGKTIVVSGKKFRYPIYWLTEEQKQNQKQKQDLEKVLKEYIVYISGNFKREDLEQSAKIEKINHLRDAITANMVGILFHLQETLGKGFIALENMDIEKAELERRLQEKGEKKQDLETGREIKMIDKHFDQSNQDISRRLEWALFRKFAIKSYVPSQIKQSIILRDEKDLYQIGILKFVKIGGTSSNCSNCGKKHRKKEDLLKHFKNNNKRCAMQYNLNDNNFILKDLYENGKINSDRVAAYNVAKNAFDNIY